MSAPSGFGRSQRFAGAPKAKQNITVKDILDGVHPELIATVSYHAALCGAFLGQSVNRKGNGVMWVCKLGDDKIGEWANTSEEAIEQLTTLSEILVETCREMGKL
jgi:hypothetical protein